jgi:hypothetical protein
MRLPDPQLPAGREARRPELEIPWPLFQTAPLNIAAILTAVPKLEPSADLAIVEVADAFDAAIRDMTVNVVVSVRPST